MLKADVDVAFTIIIFTLMVCIIIANIVNMMLSSDVRTGIVDYVKAAEFAYLVKDKLEGPDSLVDLQTMLDVERDGLRSLDLANRKGLVDEVLIGSEAGIRGEDGDQSHTVYISIKRDFYPVRYETTTIMRNLGTYIFDAYSISGRNMMIDVYQFPPRCISQAVPGSKTLTCGEVLSLASGDVRVVREIAELRDIIDKGGIAMIRLSTGRDTVIPSDFLEVKNGGLGSRDKFMFSGDPSCALQRVTTTVPVMCFRMIGDYVSPATLQAEIRSGDSFYGG